MNAADALSLLRAQAAENANGATANLATLNNGAASLFAKYRAGSLALRPKRALLFANFCYDLGQIYLPIFCMIRVKSICQFLSLRGFNATP